MPCGKVNDVIPHMGHVLVHQGCPPTDFELSLDSTNLSERHPSWLLLSAPYLLQIFLPYFSSIYCKEGRPASKNSHPGYHWGIALSGYTPSPIRGSTFDIFPLRIQKKSKVVWKAFPKQCSTVNSVNNIWCLCIQIYLYIKLYIYIYILALMLTFKINYSLTQQQALYSFQNKAKLSCFFTSTPSTTLKRHLPPAVQILYT